MGTDIEEDNLVFEFDVDNAQVTRNRKRAPTCKSPVQRMVIERHSVAGMNISTRTSYCLRSFSSFATRFV